MGAVVVFGALFLLLYGGLAVMAWRRALLRRLAVKESVRRIGQSLLVIGGLMVGSVAITASLVGADSTVESSLLNSYRQWGTIDITVTAQGAFFPREYASRLAQDLANARVDGVAAGLDLVGSVADLDSRQGESGVTIFGFDPAAQRSFGAFELTNGERTFGDGLGPGIGPGRVIINTQAAEALDAKVGDRLRVSIATPGAPAVTPELRVAAITRMRGPGAFGLRAAVFAPLDTARTFLGTDQANVVRISARGGVVAGLDAAHTAAPAVRKAVADLGSPIQLSVRESKSAEVEAARTGTEFIRAMLLGMSAIVVAAGAALIVNLVSMLAEERRPRMAVLRALGLSRKGLVLLSVLEGAIFSIVAAIAGTAVGVLGGRIVAARFADAFNQFTGGQFDFEFVFRVKTSTLAGAFAAGAVLTLVVVLFSSWRTARMSITAAIRNLPDPEQERKRAGWFRITLRVLGGLIGVGGVASSDDFNRLVGGIVLIVLVSTLVRHRVAPRWRATVTGLVLGAWCLWVLLEQDPSADAEKFFTVFVVSMLTAVFGFSIVAIANLRIVERFVGLLGRLVASLRPVLRPPLAYLARRPVRTGLTTGVFALVLGMIEMFAVFLFIFRPQYTRDSAGFDVRVLSTGRASISLPANVSNDVERTVSIPTRGYVGAFNSPNGFTGERVFVPLFVFDERLLAAPPVHLAQRDEKYPDDAAVWAALRRDPKLVVTDFGGPGQKIEMRGPNGKIEYTVAASQGFGVVDGVIGTAETLAPFRDMPLGATVLVDVKPGVSANRIAHEIESGLFDAGVDAASTRKLLDDGYRANRSFFSIIDALMRMGLIIGVLSLGIVGARTVIERRHVIGVLRAVGYNRRAVLGGLMAEAAATAFIGGFVGIFTGTLMGYVFYRQSDVKGSFGVDLPMILGALAIVFAAVLVVTVGPAYRASRLPPAEAVRYSE